MIFSKIRNFIVLSLTILLMASLVLLTLTMHKFVQAVDMADMSGKVIQSITAVKYTLLDAESGQRGYIITGDKKYLEPYNHAVAVVDGNLQDLTDTARNDNFDDGPEVVKLIDLAKSKMDELAHTIKLRQDSGFDASKDVVMTDSGKKIMDEVRSIISRITEKEVKHLMNVTNTLKQISYVVIYGLIFIFSVVVCLLLLGNLDKGLAIRNE